jgi:hypothetical protein
MRRLLGREHVELRERGHDRALLVWMCNSSRRQERV